jgi:hypothetical protein
MNMSPYGNVEISELVTMLVEARNIDEQVRLHFPEKAGSFYY